MCQFGTSDESFQNHHLAGTLVTVKLALRAGPSGQLVELAITLLFKLEVIFFVTKMKCKSDACEF
jgi:hypothetical protein